MTERNIEMTDEQRRSYEINCNRMDIRLTEMGIGEARLRLQKLLNMKFIKKLHEKKLGINTIVMSADNGDSHGCTEGWVAVITGFEPADHVVIATITENRHCYSCWQTGCIDDGEVEDGDWVGRTIRFSVNDCEDMKVSNFSFV